MEILKTQLTQYEKSTLEKWSRQNGIPLNEIMDEARSLNKKHFIIDIIKLDDKLGEVIPEYKPELCTYNGEESMSLKDVMTEVYGEELTGIIEKLL